MNESDRLQARSDPAGHPKIGRRPPPLRNFDGRIRHLRAKKQLLICVTCRAGNPTIFDPLFTHQSASMIEDGGVEKPGFNGAWPTMWERGLGFRNPFLSPDALGFTSSH